MISEQTDALESLVGQVADEFTRRHLRGERPRIEEYIERHPELADLLRDILPTIQALGATPERVGSDTPHTRDTPGGAASVPLPQSFDEYEVLAEVGRGGMGVVYKARDRRLGRVVAMKALRSDSAVDLVRFRNEAQAVARLQHPNVVQIFEIREVSGQPLLVLEYVAGGTLAERVKGEPQSPRQAAALIRRLAQAIAAAHDCGLVHRDLKPSNILLSNDASDSRTLDTLVPKITDFGLVKRLDDDVGQTQTGAIVGTPSYMAPEQAAAGSPVGPAADIFALGAILYELITGRPPFKGPSTLETLDLVRGAEPASPAHLQPGCPRDLETICLKCLRKDPAARYRTAEELADDLQRFLDGVPIHARPVRGIERLGKWLRRRPAVAASIGLGALAVIACVVLGVRLVYSWDLEDANRRLGNAVSERETALIAADEARLLAQRNHQEADNARGKLDVALEHERALHYIHSIGLAYREWRANRVDEARAILDACPEDLRRWEWHYVNHLCHVELLTIRSSSGNSGLAISPDGGLIAAAYTLPKAAVRNLTVWDAVSGTVKLELPNTQEMVSGLAFSAEGNRFAYLTSHQTIHICGVPDGRDLCTITGPTKFGRLAFSPDGTRLAATAGSRIHVYDATNGNELFTLSGHTVSVLALAFSPDGRRLVSGGSDRLVKLWDLTDRKEVFSGGGHSKTIPDVAFSPRGDQIVSCSGVLGDTKRGEIRVWNANDGNQAPLIVTFPFTIVMAAFTAETGQVVCLNQEGDLLFVDASSGQTTFTFHAPGSPIRNAAVSRDGTRVVTLSADGTIRVWPTRNPEFAQIPGDSANVTALAYTPDGTRLAVSDSGDAPQPNINRLRPAEAPPDMVRIRVRLIPLKPGAGNTVELKPMVAVSPGISVLTYSPDNRRLAGVDRGGIHLWNLDDAAAYRYILEPEVSGVCFSPDSLHLATATRNREVKAPPGLVSLFRTEPAQPGSNAWIRPQQASAIKVWRVADGQLERTLPGQSSVSFSPDGRRIAGARDRSVVLWDATTGEELRTLAGPADPVAQVQFADGGRQVVGFTNRQATVWDADTGKTVATVDGVNGPAFITPDGRRIVGLHKGIKWWDVQLGREVLFLPLALNSFRPVPLALSPDGRRVVTCVDDGRNGSNCRLALWEAGP